LIDVASLQTLRLAVVGVFRGHFGVCRLGTFIKLLLGFFSKHHAYQGAGAPTPAQAPVARTGPWGFCPHRLLIPPDFRGRIADAYSIKRTTPQPGTAAA
jgi:hypothetical protein